MKFIFRFLFFLEMLSGEASLNNIFLFSIFLTKQVTGTVALPCTAFNFSYFILNLERIGSPKGLFLPSVFFKLIIRRTLRLEINRMQLTSAKEIKRLNPKFLFEVMLFDRTNAMFLGKLKGPTILSFNERNRCLIIVLSFPYLLETYQNSM